MQQLKRSYSLTDLGEQQFDQHRFTDVTEEEEGAIFLSLISIFFHIFTPVAMYRATVTCSQSGFK